MDKDGFSRKAVLEGLLKRTKRADEREKHEASLYVPPLPPAAVPIWNTYWRLRRRQGSSGMGVSPIPWSEIDAFERRAQIELSPWEIGVIEMIDDIYLAAHSQAAR